jgi:hypothetical protein
MIRKINYDEYHLENTIKAISTREDNNRNKEVVDKKYVNFNFNDSISSMDSSLSILNEEQKKAIDDKIKRSHIFFGRDKNMVVKVPLSKSNDMPNNTFYGTNIKSNKHLLCKCHLNPIEHRSYEIKNKINLKKIPLPRKHIV